MELEEQVEWDDVNKVLQRHGFKSVYFADPVENKNLSDLVLLDKKSAGEIRTTLRTMLTDSERRQALIQELIKSNNQLKEEAHEHMSRAAQQSQRVTELEELLDVVKTKVQDLEDRYLGKAVQQHSHTQQLQQEKQEAQKVCQALEQKLSKQREEAAQLERKLYFTIKEEERRLARRSQTFQHICDKVMEQKSPADQQVLDVIDFYETKMTQLLDELSATPSAYQDQLKGSKGQMEELKREVECLKQELEARCVCAHVRVCIDVTDLCRLQKEDKTTENSENISDQSREVSLCAHYHHVKVSSVVSSPRAPLQLHRQKTCSVGLERAEFQTLAPTLEAWAQQLHLLKDLQQGLNKLTSRLMPWQSTDGDHGAAEAVKVEDMMLQVDTMLENISNDDEKVLRTPTRYTLGSMVSHFQKLFDVTSLSGVYPRMNEVYTRLGEMTNTMRNLRDVLELDSRVPPAEVVNKVARLASSTEHTAGFHQLLGEADIDSIIVKVKQHDEFFPAFHALTTDILHTLGVSHLDDILPALKSLKQTAQ
uniref:Centrosomal protein of 70 kDa n=1 Tax=Sparus aurata TaxID=8175 RepID=A0A671V983_SPAAU